MASPTEDKTYERAVAQHERDQLVYYTKKADTDQGTEEDNKLFANMSLKQIIKGISQTFIDIINEIVSGEIKTLSHLVVTLFREDRMIYVGVLCVMIAFAFYMIDITS